MVRANGAVSLRELARVVQTSEVTVRRDVRALEAEGLLDRRHGGAVLPGGFTRESGFPQKSHLATAEKTAIADLAAGLVEEGEAIVVGAGTTTQELARRLARVPGLTVVTNSLLVAQALAHANRVEVVMTGGTLRGSNYALVGSGAEQSLQGLRVSRAFLSGSGLTAERGLSTSNMLSASVDRALVQAAAEVVVLADHTKLGTDTMFQTVPTDVITRLVTDEPPAARRPRRPPSCRPWPTRACRSRWPGRPGARRRASRRSAGAPARRDVPLPGPRRGQLPAARRAIRCAARCCGEQPGGTGRGATCAAWRPASRSTPCAAGRAAWPHGGAAVGRSSRAGPALQAAQGQGQQAVRQVRVVRGLLGGQRDRVGQLEQVADGDVRAYGAGLLGAGEQGAPASRIGPLHRARAEVVVVRRPTSGPVARPRYSPACVTISRSQVTRRCTARAASSSSRERASRSLTASSKTALSRAWRFGKWR